MIATAHNALIRYALLAAALLLMTAPAWAADPFGTVVARFIEEEIGQLAPKPVVTRQNGRILATDIIPAFYAGRGYRPVWVADYRLLPTAVDLLENLRDAGHEGLNPADYHIERIAGLAAALADDQHAPVHGIGFYRWAHLDLLLTDAFLLYASHLAFGRVDPQGSDSPSMAFSPRANMAAVLSAALDSGDISGTLKPLAPGQPEYAKLKKALGRYRRVTAGGEWPKIPEGEVLRPGDHSIRIPRLRRRLMASGDLQGPLAAVEVERFGDSLVKALVRFQRRNGLTARGILDSNTLAALNIPLEKRIQQIEYNLERWRWIARDLDRRHILVNVADFSLKVVENGRPVLRMPVVVGKPYSPTPAFSSRITYLVINPVWTIPPRIAREDLLPKIKADPDFLKEQKIHLFASWLPDAPEIDPYTIDWAAVGPDHLPYKLQQDPGPQNELGRMKFMFPNRFSVYLHDTPHRDQFFQPQRDLSSGCIRLEKPVDLATTLLKDSPGWTREKIVDTINRGREMVVGLKTPITIHLFYWTAWVDDTGELQFRKDIYGRDTSLRRALEERTAAEGVTTAGRDRHPGAKNRF